MDALQELRDSIRNDLHSLLVDLDRQIVIFKLAQNPEYELLECIVADAIMFIAHLPELLPLPTVIIAEDGEVIFEWSLNGNKRATVGLEGDGSYGYNMKRGKDYYPGRYEGCVMGDFPEDLEEYLSD